MCASVVIPIFVDDDSVHPPVKARRTNQPTSHRKEERSTKDFLSLWTGFAKKKKSSHLAPLLEDCPCQHRGGGRSISRDIVRLGRHLTAPIKKPRITSERAPMTSLLPWREACLGGWVGAGAGAGVVFPLAMNEQRLHRVPPLHLFVLIARHIYAHVRFQTTGRDDRWWRALAIISILMIQLAQMI